MNRSSRFLVVPFLLIAFISGSAADKKNFVYASAPKSEQSDDYFGTKVADPYRPLEDADSKPAKKWIEEENKLTFDYLAKIPQRKQIKQRLTALWNYERYG